MRAILKTITPQQFLRVLDNMVANKMMSKSERHRDIKDMRHILGMSWEDYLKMRGK